MTQLERIRRNERISHIETYSNHALYEPGSWLAKPAKTVMDLLPFFDLFSSIRILDLGCGVGRNSIALAQAFQDIDCCIDCVDILDFAIEKLKENSEKFGVSPMINGITESIDRYPIPVEGYDWILAVSALEHMDSKESLIQKLKEIRSGIRDGGVVCLILNSDVKELCHDTKQVLRPQFEVNLPTSELQEILYDIFSGWTTLKNSFQMQKYDIPRNGCISELSSNVITFAAQK